MAINDNFITTKEPPAKTHEIPPANQTEINGGNQRIDCKKAYDDRKPQET